MKRSTKPAPRERFGKNNPALVVFVSRLRALERAVRALHPRAVGATLIIDLGPRGDPLAVPVFFDGSDGNGK